LLSHLFVAEAAVEPEVALAERLDPQHGAEHLALDYLGVVGVGLDLGFA
jgi:hypothetical protein